MKIKDKKVSDNLRYAKKDKNDEFFTQYDDVKKGNRRLLYIKWGYI